MRHALFVFALLIPAQLTYGHGTLISPAPRYNSNGLTNANAPCGDNAGLTSTANITEYVQGSSITVTYREVQEHSGTFAFYFSAANDEQSAAKPGALKDILLQGIVNLSNDVGVGARTATISLPNITCTDCTLQMVMLNGSGGIQYVSCADIRLISSGSSPAPAPSSAPTPDEDDHSNHDHSAIDANSAATGGCGLIKSSNEHYSYVVVILSLLMAVAALWLRSYDKAKI